MKKKKSHFLHYLSFMITFLALGAIVMAAGRYVSSMSAMSYEDCGVMEFVAAEWYTKTENVRRQGGVPAHTRYIYYVRYASMNSGRSSYSYHERESSYKKAVATVNLKARIRRRVLSDDGNYITIPADKTKAQWLNKTRIWCFAVFFFSAAYLVGFIVSIVRKKFRE